jgi:epoxyqueuosine reductase
MGDRIFGCDDCLDACPWNRFACLSREAAFHPAPVLSHTPLRDFLSMDDSSFRNTFRQSPIRRAKRRGFLRNVCVALGNTGDARDLPALQHALHDTEPLISEHAAWAIAEIEARGMPAA